MVAELEVGAEVDVMLSWAEVVPVGVGAGVEAKAAEQDGAGADEPMYLALTSGWLPHK